MTQEMPGRTTIARVFLPFAFGYFLSYLFRVINAVIAPSLVHDLALTPGDLGLLTGVYFMTFAPAQLPLGIALDHWGARRTKAAMLLFAVAGALCFATADGFAGVLFGRALIGLGVSACLMAAFKSFVVWFPASRLPQINGWQMAAGGLGAISATTPVAAALTVIGWRGVFGVTAALTAAAALMIFVLVPERRQENAAHTVTFAEMMAGTRRVFASSLFWRVVPMTVASQATFLSIQGLWLGPWLRDVARLSPAAVAEALLVVAVAMVAGFITLGWAGARTAAWGLGPLPVTAAGIGVFALVQTAIIVGATQALPLLLPLFGFFGTSAIVAYSGLTQRFPPALAGRVNTALNLLVFVAAFAVQWGMGAVIGHWPSPAAGEYAPEGYRAAFGLMLGMEGLALTWFFTFRRTGVPAA
ncbi:MAG: MFS transporter [Rhodospirillales bacterium]